MKMRKTISIPMSKAVPLLFSSALLFFACFALFNLFLRPSHALTPLTVCPVGCDYTNLTSAVTDPGIPPFIITIEDDYVFDDTIEADDVFPQADTTIQCEVGAVVGDSLQDDMTIWPGNDNIIQDCTFENINFDSSNVTNVDFLNNTFTANADSVLIFTNTNGFEVSDSVGLQKIQIQNANNGTIDNNELECRFGNNCLNLTTAGGGPFDYGDTADVPANIDITNNTFSNFNTSTTGDWIHAFAGVNINFEDNTFQSAVTIDDQYVTMVTTENAESYFANNFFIFPDRDPGDTQGTWGLNIRVSDYDANVVAQNNTFILGGAESTASSNSCFGIFDDGINPGVDINVTFSYNICYNSFDTQANNGLNFGYSAGTSTLNLTEEYNGFYGIDTLVFDDTGAVTSLDATTLTSDPLLRTENGSSTDDYQPSPISRYLDINGTNDIGAYSSVRVSTYTIDDDCTVDYTTCFSNESSTLTHSVKTGDDITVAAGSYDSLILDYPANNVTLTGSGISTIFDANSNGSAVSLEGIDSSNFSDFQAEGSISNTTETYDITHILYEYSGDIYDDSLGLTGTANQTFIFSDASCTVILPSADGIDITTAIGPATDNWNLGLADVFGNKITILVPDRFVSDATELSTYTLNECGAPSTIDLFLPDVFEVSAGDYTYNSTTVSAAGVTLKAGITDPPVINRTITTEEAAGVLLTDSDGNTFDNITSTDNGYAVGITGTSDGNSIEESTLANSATGDLLITGDGDNELIDTSFDRTTSLITGSGETTILYSVRAYVSDDGDPVDLADVTFTSADVSETEMEQTDPTGYTPYTSPLIAFILTQADISETAGGLNLYSANVNAPGTGSENLTFELNTPQQTVTIAFSGSGGGSEFQKPGTPTLQIHPENCTPSRDVEIHISGDDIKHVIIANDDMFTGANWQSYEAPESTYSWKLTDGGGLKTIYVIALSSSGNISEVQSTTVSLDQTTTCGDDSEQEPDEEDLLFDPGTLIKGSADTVYYYGRDGKRHAFPDTRTFGSWFSSFNNVIHLSDEELRNIPLGENATHRPGSLIKFRAPQVYFVGLNQTLHHIVTEQIAIRLFGVDWAKLVKDLDDAFWGDYSVEEEIASEDDINFEEINAVETLDEAAGY